MQKQSPEVLLTSLCPITKWHQRCPLGKKVLPGNSKFENITPLEAFLMMMLLDELNLILEQKNESLESSGKKQELFDGLA